MSGTIPLLDSDDAPEDLGAVAESSAPPQEGPVVAPPEAGPAQPGVGPAQPGAEARPVESAPSAEPTTSADRKPEKDVAEEPVEPEPALSAEIESETAEAEEPAQPAETVEAAVESEESAESVVAEEAGSVPMEVTSEPESEAPVEEPAGSVVESEADEPAQPAAVETGTVAESAETETEAARSVEQEADENTGAAEEIAVGVEESAQEEQSAETAEPVESEESADPEPVESESAGPEPESAEKADAVAEAAEPEGPVEVVDSVQGESVEEADVAEKTAVGVEESAQGAEESAQGERPAEPAEPVESETAESGAAEEAAAGSGPAVEETQSAEPAIEGQSAQEAVDEATPAPPSAAATPTERASEAATAGASAARPPLRPNFSLSAPTPAAAESATGAPSRTIEYPADAEAADMSLPPSVPIAARTPERDDASEEAVGTIGATGRAPAGSEAEEAADDESGVAAASEGADDESGVAAASEAADDESGEARDEQVAAEQAPAEQKKSEAVAPARRRRLLLALGAAALLVLVWGAAAFATTQHIFAGSTVSGVAVGNMSPAQAESTVAGAIDARLGQPVTLVVGNATDTLVPAESGVSVDARASVERLTGFTLNPLTLIGRLRGADVDAVTRVDARSLTTALDARLDVLAVGASDAGVTLNGTTPVLIPGSIGTGLDVDSAVTTLSENWPLGRETIELPDGEARPAITDEEAQTLIDKVLTPLLSSDFTITVEGTDAAARAWRPTVVLTPEQLAELVRIDTADGDITASLDPQGLRETVLAAMGPEIESPVQDATWTIEGRADAKPVYVEAHGGTVVDAEALAADVLTAATQDGGAGERRIALPMIDQAPAVTTPAADWGMNQVIGEYSTPYYPDAARTQNLVAGTAAINGTVVMPGGEFSLTEALGPIDEEHGFASAGVVTNGQHTDAMGGGLSQVATTVFNAGFEAGMDDVEHTPHNYWFTRYPAGREATLWTGNLDVKFGNSTPTAVMVQAWAVDGEVHVRLWGTPYYQVSIDNGTPHNYRAYQTQRQSGGNCVPYGGGAQGFDITVTRSRTKPDGQKLPDDVLSTSYDSDNPVVCG